MSATREMSSGGCLKRTNMKNTTDQMTLSIDCNVTARYNNGMFVKLFSQILDSSIADNRKLRHFSQTCFCALTQMAAL